MFFNELIKLVCYGDLPTSYYVKRGMKVGKHFNRQAGSKFDPAHCWLIEIGDYVTISNRVIVLAHDDSLRIHTGHGLIGRVKIGNRVFIGANSTILPGVEIGDNVIIGAGSVVNRSIPANNVAVGVPAKPICSVNDYVNKHLELMKTRSCFDNSYSYDQITDEKKAELCRKLENDNGYLKLKDFTQFK